MASFGGKLQIDSAPGNGTRITLIAWLNHPFRGKASHYSSAPSLS
jgi:hypothetical protein